MNIQKSLSPSLPLAPVLIRELSRSTRVDRKGKRVTPLDQEFEPIRGGSKYLWQSADPPVALRTTKTAPATSPAAPEEQA